LLKLGSNKIKEAVPMDAIPENSATCTVFQFNNGILK
jgi:hypothetical protein